MDQTIIIGTCIGEWRLRQSAPANPNSYFMATLKIEHGNGNQLQGVINFDVLNKWETLTNVSVGADGHLRFTRPEYNQVFEFGITDSVINGHPHISGKYTNFDKSFTLLKPRKNNQ